MGKKQQNCQVGTDDNMVTMLQDGNMEPTKRLWLTLGGRLQWLHQMIDLEQDDFRTVPSKMSQNEFAAYCGIAPSTMSRLLHRSHAGRSSESLVKIAEACHVSLSWLMTGEGQPRDDGTLETVAQFIPAETLAKLPGGHLDDEDSDRENALALALDLWPDDENVRVAVNALRRESNRDSESLTEDDWLNEVKLRARKVRDMRGSLYEPDVDGDLDEVANEEEARKALNSRLKPTK